MIETRGLTKRYGELTAVDGLSIEVRPGRVTGFLGANGAGKSTTLRMVLGLDAPTSGAATVDGRPYRALRTPAQRVGALLDPRSADPRRTARAHLGWMTAAAGLPRGRVDEVLAQVDLTRAADRRVGALSLGMRQRVGIAGALLGDPAALVLDEPLNGLDPAGIRWVRDLLRGLAAEGRTVFLSSHLMAEMEQTADTVVVIADGRLVGTYDVAELAARSHSVRVAATSVDDTARLADALRSGRAAGSATGGTTDRGGRPAVVSVDGDGIVVGGLDPAVVGRVALDLGIVLRELTQRADRLEESFLALTAEARGHAERSAGGEGGAGAAGGGGAGGGARRGGVGSGGVAQRCAEQRTACSHPEEAIR